MEVKVIFKGKLFPIIINENDTVYDFYEKCDENILKKFPHERHSFILLYITKFLKKESKEILKNYKNYKIEQNDLISMYMEDEFI